VSDAPVRRRLSIETFLPDVLPVLTLAPLVSLADVLEALGIEPPPGAEKVVGYVTAPTITTETRPRGPLTFGGSDEPTDD